MRRFILVHHRRRRRRAPAERADRRLRPGNHGTEHNHRHHQGVPARDAARAARQDQTNGAAAERLYRPRAIRRARSPSVADARRRLSVRQRHQRGADFRRSGRCRLPRGEPSRGERQSPSRQTHAGRTARHDQPTGDHELADAVAMSAINDTGPLRLTDASRSCRRSMRWKHRSSTRRTSRAPPRCWTRSAAPSSSAPGSDRRGASCWPPSWSSCWSTPSVTATPTPPR